MSGKANLHAIDPAACVAAGGHCWESTGMGNNLLYLPQPFLDVVNNDAKIDISNGFTQRCHHCPATRAVGTFTVES